ncbi:MAG: hypothetical protein LBQ00_09405 [Syntrophobacterales bacterium]|nr:hypothetical protein [Syntrophobacterales bacterium]
MTKKAGVTYRRLKCDPHAKECLTAGHYGVRILGPAEIRNMGTAVGGASYKLTHLKEVQSSLFAGAKPD